MHHPTPLLTKRITVSIEEDLRDDLNFLTDVLDINRSSLIRGLIMSWMISRKVVFQSADIEPKCKTIKKAIGSKPGENYSA